MSNTKVLILTEKPSVARDFAKTLGVSTSGKSYFENSDYVITWAIGHLLVPLDPDDYNPIWKKWSLASLPIIPDRLLYRANGKTKSQLKSVILQLRRKDITEILVATDAGREGELIARTIIVESKVKLPAYRFWTSEALTSEVITREMGRKRPLKSYDRLYIAGKARQFADWLVGMNLSRLATLKMGELFSVGRVQTAVLALLVARRKEIDSFTSVPYWQLKANTSFDSGECEATWFDPILKDDSTVITSEDRAREIASEIKGQSVEVRKAKSKENVTPPPGLFSLTDLQRLANKMYGLSAKNTLDVAQRLYEKHKCISYPRTDSTVMGESNLPMIEELYNNFSNFDPKLFSSFDPSKLSLSNRNLFNDSKLTDHHALIPLKPFRGQKGGDEEKVYNLILRRFAIVLSKDHIAVDTNVRFKIGIHNFKAKGKTVVEVGWKALIPPEKDKLLPKLSEGDVGKVLGGAIKTKKTLPPSEYSESMLLKDMTNPARLVDEREHKKLFRGQVGLGTQATRAQIIETLLSRKYIKRSKRSLIALPKGVTLIDTLGRFKYLAMLTGASETAKWELELDGISCGESNGLEFVNGIKSFVSNCIAEWK